MKILFVITGLTQGGAERVVCDLADNMYEKGNIVKIAYLTGDILTQPVHREIELIKLGLNGLGSFLPGYITLSKLIRSYCPNVVHAHMVHANILTRLIRLTTTIDKLICTAHSSNEGGKLRMCLYRVTHNLADLTTNVSDTAVASFEEKRAVPKKSMRTTYNGIDFERFSYNPEAKKELTEELNLYPKCRIILSVGRFNIQKNYPNLLKATDILKRKYFIDFRLLIAGDGELRSELEQLIIDLDLEHEVTLLGRRRDIPRLMSACDVFVLSSNNEGLPTVLIEALACQAHIVSTDVSGVREIVGDYGKIVSINNPEHLAECIFNSLNHKNKNELGCEYVKNKFELNTITNEWLKIYNET